MSEPTLEELESWAQANELSEFTRLTALRYVFTEDNLFGDRVAELINNLAGETTIHSRFALMRSVAKVVGVKRTRSAVFAVSSQFDISRKPGLVASQKANLVAYRHRLLKAQFVMRVLELEQRSQGGVQRPTRPEALLTAAKEVQEQAGRFFAREPKELQKWQVIEHRGLEKRFKRLADEHRKANFIGEAGVNLGGTPPPRFSISDLKGKRGRPANKNTNDHQS